jgi:hypothetical protein
MGEVIELADNLLYTTTTADVTSPDDFVVEFLTEDPETEKSIPSKIRIKNMIKNMDELIDFLETLEW